MHEKYKPLPENLTVKKSLINGLGIFATKDIREGFNLGLTHYIDSHNSMAIRTPLGGFYNHSDNPNCIKIEGLRGSFYIKTLRPIKKGEEITVKYTFYKIGV